MAGWEGGSTWRWRKIRRQVLDRDRWLCQVKIEGTCKHKADCVHHLLGKAQGDNPADLVASCTPCNLHIGNPARNDPAPRSRTVW